MAPGIPSSPPSTTSTSPPKKKPYTLPSSDQPPSTGSNTLASLTETWEEVREAVMETEFVTALSEKATRVTKVVNKVWNLSRAVAWVVGTSALVLVIPLLYEIDKELGPTAEQQQQQVQAQSTGGGNTVTGEAPKSGNISETAGTASS